ncbi:hypothetical protein [Streptomyces sp. LN704]|uniref:hypothetical protein n=1 Tax=Streptomyces sp. LN704 TaxID=3112982 RepID=UPI0037175C1E
MAQNLMVWLIERRVVLEERAAQLRKQLADTEAELEVLGLLAAGSPPRYLLRGSAMGPPAFGSGMTSPLVAVDDPGGGVTGSGGIDGPLMRGLSTGFTQAGRALRNVDVAARCRGKAGRRRDGGACT